MVAPPDSPEPPVSQSMPGDKDVERLSVGASDRSTRETLILNPSIFIRILAKKYEQKYEEKNLTKKWRQKDKAGDPVLHFFVSIFLTSCFTFSDACFLPNYPKAYKPGGVYGPRLPNYATGVRLAQRAGQAL